MTIGSIKNLRNAIFSNQRVDKAEVERLLQEATAAVDPADKPVARNAAADVLERDRLDYPEHEDAGGKIHDAALKSSMLAAHIRIDNRVIPVTRKDVYTADGRVDKIEFYTADGSKLSAAQANDVFYSQHRNTTRYDSSRQEAWWGACDKVSLAGVLFREPQRDVTIDGETFTPQDISSLLSAIAHTKTFKAETVDTNSDERSDVVTLRSGKVLKGVIQSAAQFSAQAQDTQAHGKPTADLTVNEETLRIKLAHGEIRSLQAHDIKDISHAQPNDVSPVEFHNTMLKWLDDDRRSSRTDQDRVWHYNFWKADLRQERTLAEDEDVTAPEATSRGETIEFALDVFFGESTGPQTFRYWIEHDTSGKAVNGAWKSESPEFLWRSGGYADWSSLYSGTPFVDPRLVREIFEKSLGTTPQDLK